MPRCPVKIPVFLLMCRFFGKVAGKCLPCGKLANTFLPFFLILFVPLSVWAEVWPVYVGDPEYSEQGAAARAFKEYVEEKTGGGVRIALYYASQLADEGEAFRNVQAGAMPLAIGTIANLVPLDRRLAILTLPYLFNSLEDALAGTSGKAAELLESYALESGFRILCWTLTDFRYISNSRRPIRKMADMRGLKFRVPQSAVFIAAYRAFGASPVPISWGETFTALQQGVVDGQCYGYIGFLSMKFLDARQKYLAEVHYTYQIQPLLISEKFYSRLPEDLRGIVTSAGRHAAKKSLAYLKTNSTKARKELVARGLEINPLEDEEEWRDTAYAKVWPKVAEKVGGYAAIKRYFAAWGRELPPVFARIMEKAGEERR